MSCWCCHRREGVQCPWSRRAVGRPYQQCEGKHRDRTRHQGQTHTQGMPQVGKSSVWCSLLRIVMTHGTMIWHNGIWVCLLPEMYAFTAMIQCTRLLKTKVISLMCSWFKHWNINLNLAASVHLNSRSTLFCGLKYLQLKYCYCSLQRIHIWIF